ncbi:MAG: ChrR family anti-sigma-E factor [Yoonia sp.]|uniref:ChrR family anti-sigma-E factor n=1 Tax=Rhodobacterales TaxID=204455 RepID=UPI001FF45829|nr:ChrR family anti-sigma-E factor [Loktanella sp. F6476L]MCK0121838.1 ChrR family anti-sigma-E factor [Loktanella sp. F6476L]UWR00002.1 ChrR family anti-sigma-E factor [Rhodobacteraceae bacterium S2214]
MTTTIKHHLTDDLLMGYSAGALPEAFNVVVATHISLCDECRARLASFDAVGGAVVESVDAVDMAEDSLAAVMAKISAKPDAPVNVPTPRTSSIFPTPLQEYISGNIDDVKWRKIGGGVSQAVLKTSKDASVRLLRIPAGTAVPDHGHRGTELTLVLQGAFKDEHDRFGKGDIEVANEDLHHTPVAEDGMDCICLAASDAPLKFNGFLPRLAQRFVGI